MARRIPPQLPAVLMLGIVGQISQILLLRELLMVFHGSEFSIGLILAAWLAWVAVGSRLGAALAETSPHPLALLTASAAGILVALPITLVLIRGLRGFFAVIPGAYLSLPQMALSCFVLLAPVCLLLGAQFVLLARAWRDSDQTVDTSSANKTYMFEAAGNVIGGIVFTLLMVQHLNAFESAALAGMLMLAAHLALSRKPERRPFGPYRVALLGMLGLATILFGTAASVDNWANRLQWQDFAPLHRLVRVSQSQHGTIAVLQSEDQYSFFQSGNLVFTTAGPEAASPGLEEQEAANLAHLAMVQHERPERVLLIGGGLRGTLSEALRHPVERIDYIELDVALTKAAQPFVSPATQQALADPRVRLIHTDGRLYVKGARERYDIIIVDSPDPATAVLNRYYTYEFFREAAALLNPDGVFVIGATSTPGLQSIPLANRNSMIYHTLGRVFPRVLVAGDRTLLFFATRSAGQISVDVPTLQGRFLDRGIASPTFNEHHYQVLLQEPQLRRVNWIVRNHGRSRLAHREGPGPVPLSPGSIVEQEAAQAGLPPVAQPFFINSDLKPLGYAYTLMYWDDRMRAGGNQAFAWMLRLEPWWFLPIALAPLVAILGARVAALRNRRRPNISLAVLVAVFMTGFSTMALQIAMLFSFQSVYGFVYEMVGLIMAMFMGGLALGTWLSHRHVAHKTDILALAAVQLVMALYAGVIALALPAVAAIPYAPIIFALFSTLTFAAGLFNGLGFPLAAACYRAQNQRADKSVGAVYSVELLGACLGAILASAVVAPMLGIVAACLLAAAANGTALAGLLISGRSHV